MWVVCAVSPLPWDWGGECRSRARGGGWPSTDVDVGGCGARMVLQVGGACAVDVVVMWEERRSERRASVGEGRRPTLAHRGRLPARPPCAANNLRPSQVSQTILDCSAQQKRPTSNPEDVSYHHQLWPAARQRQMVDDDRRARRGCQSRRKLKSWDR